MNDVIFRCPITNETDVVAVRQKARRVAELLGLPGRDQTRMATAASEIARNAFVHAGGGQADFALDDQARPQALVVTIGDRGPGIADLAAILEGRASGLGLVSARRLIDSVRIDSERGRGTSVELRHRLPAQAPRVGGKRLREIAELLRRDQVADPLSVVSGQNRELLNSLQEANQRQEESERLTRELEETNRGVVALYAELEEKAEQLRQASELKSRFLSNMSHEFRTPLNSILALSKLLLDGVDGKLSAEQERQVGYMRRSAEALLDLVNDLLDIAKVEAGKVDVRASGFTVAELFGMLRGALKPLQTNALVSLVFGDGKDLPPLVTDEAKVAQILRNFIANALKFTERGEVRVSCRHDAAADQMLLAVADSGVGIAPEHQERIFEEFVQIDNPLQKSVKGTGLGLALSRRLAELLGGRILLDSSPGAGSTFTLAIPRRLAPPAEAGRPGEDRPGEDRPGEDRPEEDRPGQGQRGEDARDDTVPWRVLVIDDEETFRYVIRQIVTADARYQIDEAVDGQAGLDVARTHPPDVILLDLQMPKLDGFAVLRELRGDPALRTTPVIVSTSLPIDEELMARLPGIQAIFAKQDLSRETVHTLLHQATAGRGSHAH